MPIAPSLESATPIPAALEELVPESVSDASAQFGEVYSQVLEAKRQLDAAREGVQGAEAADAASARSAVDAGERIPKPTAPKASERLAGAQREFDATKRVATERLNAYLGQVREHRAEIAWNVTQRLGEATAVVEATINDVENAFGTVADLKWLASQLADDERLSGGAASFLPTPPTSRHRVRDPLSRPAREAIDALRGEVGIAQQEQEAPAPDPRDRKAAKFAREQAERDAANARRAAVAAGQAA